LCEEKGKHHFWTKKKNASTCPQGILEKNVKGRTEGERRECTSTKERQGVCHLISGKQKKNEGEAVRQQTTSCEPIRRCGEAAEPEVRVGLQKGFPRRGGGLG